MMQFSKKKMVKLLKIASFTNVFRQKQSQQDLHLKSISIFFLEITKGDYKL